MALLGPRKVYFPGISRPYPPPLFTLLPVTSQLMVQFGNDQKLIKEFAQSFSVHVLRFFCYGKLLWQIYRARCLLRALPQHRCHKVLDSKCSCKHDNHERKSATYVFPPK